MVSRRAAGAAAVKANDARVDQLPGQIDTIATPLTIDFQAAFLAARYRLGPDRARLTASLVFGEAR